MAAIKDSLVIGATGRVGRLVVENISNSGYNLTVLLRDPLKIQGDSMFTHNRIQLIKGDPCNAEDVHLAFSQILSKPRASLVIISTLGQTRKSGNPWSAVTSPAGFMSKAADAVISAARNLDPEILSRIRKYVVLSMFGVRDSFGQLNFLLKPVMHHSNMLQTLDDHNMLNDLVQKQDVLPYVLVRAAMLNQSDAMPVRTYGSNAKGVGFWPSISMASVASFLLQVGTDDAFDGKSPVITN